MAHLEVEPKPSRPWWVWLLIAIILIALAALLINIYSNDDKQEIATNQTQTNIPIAATIPDWSSVDFNSATMNDSDISDTEIQTRGNDTYTIYTLGENILFPTDGNDVSDNGKSKLQLISEILNKKYDGATIGVFGSTDSTGPAGENKELGKERAEAVKLWLSSNGKINPERISVQSLGEQQPVATNQSSEGRQQNRNVSIVVFPKK